MQTFDTSRDYILEDDFVQLRPLQENDLIHLQHFTSEKEVWRFSSIPVSDPESLGEYIRMAISRRNAGNEYPFIVYDKTKKQYAGSTRFYDIQPVNRTVQLGFTWYGKEFWGTGLNKHCKYLLLQFAFEEIGMERVEFRANNKNERSIAAMKSIGCTVEGILRNNMQNPDGTRRDSIVLSILKEEWFDSVKNLLLGKI